MKKNYWLFLLLMLVVFSCKGTPKKDQGAADPGLSQAEKTAEEDKVEAADAKTDGEAQVDESALAQESSLAQESAPSQESSLSKESEADGSEIAENLEAEAENIQADAEIEDKQPIVEAVDVKETPVQQPPPAPAVTPVQPAPTVTAVQPPPAVTVEERPAEQPAQEEQTAAQAESALEQTIPPRGQPWQTPPPAVTAVRDDAPVPNQRLLVPQKEEEIVFSRIVHAAVGQIVEIPFRGNNWSYLEERVSRRGLVYNSRRLDPEGQSFIFMAEEAGTYTLRFKKQDFLRDYFLDDYVQVIVAEQLKSGGAGWFNPPSDRVRVTAEPRWPSALDEAAMLRGARPSSGASAESAPAQGAGTAPSTAPVVVIIPPVQGTGTAPSTTPQVSQTATPQTAPQIAPTAIPQTAPQNVPQTAPQTAPTATPQAAAEPSAVEKQEKLPPEEMLKKAQEAFNEGNTAAAIALLDQFKEYYPDGSDELYWLYGQFYEANTPSRNILLSLDYYRRLVNEYPQSRRYNDARRRIAYLERFYINIQ